MQRNILLKNFTSFKIGGPAKYFLIGKNKKEILKVVIFANKIKLPLFILGSGSNLLVSDKGFNGFVLKLENKKIKIKKNKIFAESGILLSTILTKTIKNNFSGFEWAAGIPGTLGGAIYGNAGLPKESINKVIEEVEVVDLKDGKIRNLNNTDCKFGYRTSVFKENKNLVILSAVLRFKKGDRKEIKNKIKEIILQRKEKQPLNFYSAGSVFKNPKNYSAGYLIDKCGLKGKQIGKVKISEKHANFILNIGNGTAKDVKKLINLVKNKVKNKFKIILEEEIQFLGF